MSVVHESAMTEECAAAHRGDRPADLIHAEQEYAIGNAQRALELLSQFIRAELQEEALEGIGVEDSASAHGPAAARPAERTQALCDAFVLRARIHFRFAQHELGATASSSEAAPRLGHDPIVECELAVADANAALKRMPLMHAAHALRAEVAAAGLPHKLRELLVESLTLFPEDEQLMHLLMTCRERRRLKCLPARTPARSNDEESVATTTGIKIKEQEEEEEEVPPELECVLCSQLFLEPITTACGHTFCRGCLVAALDYSTQDSARQACPMCRAPIHMSAVEHQQTHVVRSVIEAFYPIAMKRRRMEQLGDRPVEAEKQPGRSSDERVLPIFVLQPVFPGHSVPLQIFEPRYRLMFRRVLQGSGLFCMVSYVSQRGASGEAEAPMALVGTILRVTESTIVADGRLLVNTAALSRCVVRRHHECDGYRIGVVVPLRDDALVEVGGGGAPDDQATAAPISTDRAAEVLQTLLQIVAAATGEQPPPALKDGVSAANLEVASLFLVPFFFRRQADLMACLSMTSTIRRVRKLEAEAKRRSIM